MSDDQILYLLQLVRNTAGMTFCGLLIYALLRWTLKRFPDDRTVTDWLDDQWGGR